MRVLKYFLISLCAITLCAAMAPGARADQWNKKTTVTFDNAVQIPGQVLEPGTYVFKVVDLPFNRDIVQVLTGDEDHVIATMLTDSDYQPQANDRSVFILDQSGGPIPVLQSWFYAGENTGQRFVYQGPTGTQEAMNTVYGH